jgi:hypothetical protein
MNVSAHPIFSNWLIDYPLLRSSGIPQARILAASTNVRTQCYKKGGKKLSLPICTTELPQKKTEAKSKATADDKESEVNVSVL